MGAYDNATVFQLREIELAYPGLGIGLYRHIQHLIEITVIEASIPPHTQQKSTHEPIHGRGIKMIQ
jgi:hypothetical protein